MQSNILSAAAIGLCLAAIAPLSAQVSEPQEEPSAPRVLMVIREQIKEGREAAHAKAEEAWPRIYQKGNVTMHYLGMTSETGPSEAWFLEPYDSFGGMEKARAELDNSPLAPDLEAANAQDGELRTGSRTLLAVFRSDLSYHPAQAMTALPKCRHMAVAVIRIKYGHDADLSQLAKLAIEGDEKSGSTQPDLTYQVISGALSGTFLIFSPMDSLARMDTAPARAAASRQAMGDRNRQHYETLAEEVVQSVESLLFAFDPRMSYVSKEFAAADPGFWNPQPKAPAKPAARVKAKTTSTP
ncbi:MAG: hypothetical protein ABSF54_02675 [Bryobacteraceae bacterium]|jgi:hypothetical protein